MTMPSGGTIAAAVRTLREGLLRGIHATEGPEWVHRSRPTSGRTDRRSPSRITRSCASPRDHFQAALDERPGACPVVLSPGEWAPPITDAGTSDRRSDVRRSESPSAGRRSSFLRPEAGGHTGTRLDTSSRGGRDHPDIPCSRGGIASGRTIAAQCSLERRGCSPPLPQRPGGSGDRRRPQRHRRE